MEPHLKNPKHGFRDLFTAIAVIHGRDELQKPGKIKIVACTEVIRLTTVR